MFFRVLREIFRDLPALEQSVHSFFQEFQCQTHVFQAPAGKFREIHAVYQGDPGLNRQIMAL